MDLQVILFCAGFGLLALIGVIGRLMDWKR